ncbi:hypothetical protein ACFVS2_26100 [Brevibacillus sp. NPDC058079]|uniref:hypothetical protein n=1 Tax=Brevibacillus sp. NPDC058079 TaxID=3346330 RepID=UPI0036E9E547
MKRYIVVFFNRFVNKIQIEVIDATNIFRAGRLFYKKRSRKQFHACIETIHEMELITPKQEQEKKFDSWTSRHDVLTRSCEVCRLEKENAEYRKILEYIADISLDKRCEKAAKDALGIK